MGNNGHFNAKGNLGFLKQRFEQNRSQGEKLSGAEFWLTIQEYPNISALVRTTQHPEMAREALEDFGPGGLKFVQHGTLKNSGEITIQCVETITGEVAKMIKKAVVNKEYVTITLQSTPESSNGNSPASLKTNFLHCLIACEQIDFASEDVTSFVRPSLRITYNWIDY